MKSIILQFATEDDLVSFAIRQFSHSQFSHVDGVLEDGRLLGARADGGVQIREPGYANFSLTKRIEIVTDSAQAVYDAALSQVGKPYDMKAISAFVFNRDWRELDHWFCSELWTWALEEGNVFPKIVQEVNCITPGDLLLLADFYARLKV